MNIKRHVSISAFIMIFILFTGFFYSETANAENKPLNGTQIAFFVGYHNNYYGYPATNYYRPQYHHRGSYKTSWTSVGHGCHKTCILDRWTGRAIRCYARC